jgi:hypothetical protein
MDDLEYDAWWDKYKPITTDHGDLRIYETYGDDLKFIESIIDDNRVWTFVDGGDYSVITNGMRFVNRLCYYVTEVPWEGEAGDIEINMYEPDECDITGEHIWFDYLREMDGKTIQVCEFCEMSKEDYDYCNG